MECSEGIEGVREDHCYHEYDLEMDVCCWCGDLFLPDQPRDTEHGEYAAPTEGALIDLLEKVKRGEVTNEQYLEQSRRYWRVFWRVYYKRGGK